MILRFALILAALLVSSSAFAQTGAPITANGQCRSIDTDNKGQGTLEVSGAWTGTLTWYVSNGVNRAAIDLGTPDAPGTAVNSTTANGHWMGNVGGWRTFEVCATATVTGAATIWLNASDTGGGGGGGGTSGGLTDAELRASAVSVTCGDCSGSGVSHIDDAAFTPATSDIVPIAGVFDDIGPDSIDEGDAGAVRMSANRNLFTTIRDAAGNERGALVTANNELLVELGAGSAAIGTVTVTDGAGALNVIVDSATLGTVTVSDGAGALNVIIDSSASLTTVEGAGALLTSSQLIDNIVSVEDAVAGSAFSGVGMLAVRQDSHTDLAADGDFIPLTIDADGGLRVSIVAGAGSGGTALADDADFTAGTTSFTPGGGFYQSTVTACTDGDTCAFGITTGRAIKAHITDAAGASMTLAADKTEDVAESGADTGPLMMAVRRDTAASSSGTSGDFSTINTDAVGRLWTSGANLEDVASATGDQGLVIFAIRDDTLDARSGTEGDFEYLHTDAAGALWVRLLSSVIEDAAETAGGSIIGVGSVRRDVAASSAGTTADNATFNTDALGLLWTRSLDPCNGVAKTHIPISISTATTTELTAALAGASTNYYVCGIDLVTAAANNVALVDDDSDGCGSVTSGLAGGTTAATGWNFAANGGLVKGNGDSTVFKSVGTNRVLCLVTSAATQLSGSIQVVAAP